MMLIQNWLRRHINCFLGKRSILKYTSFLVFYFLFLCFNYQWLSCWRIFLTENSRNKQPASFQLHVDLSNLTEILLRTWLIVIYTLYPLCPLVACYSSQPSDCHDISVHINNACSHRHNNLNCEIPTYYTLVLSYQSSLHI